MTDDEEEIPHLYETEPTPVDEKIIHQRYYLPSHPGFYWLIAEYDPADDIAFGYACLNDPEMAEWGTIDIQELRDVGAVLDDDWQPCRYREAIQKVQRGENQ